MAFGASLPSMAASDPTNLTERSSTDRTDGDSPVLSEACPPRRLVVIRAKPPGLAPATFSAETVAREKADGCMLAATAESKGDPALDCQRLECKSLRALLV